MPVSSLANCPYRRSRLLPSLALAALAASHSFPQTRSACSVQGTLFDADSGHPLGGVEVKLRRSSELDNFLYATSDSRGIFSFPELAGGSYIISVDKDFAPVFRRVPLPAGTNLNGVDLKLQHLASIRGQVVDPENVPVAGAWVSVRYITYKNTREVRAHRTSVKTGPEGEFSIGSLSPGAYLLEFQRPRLALAPFRGKDGEERPPVREPVSTYYPGVTDAAEAEQVVLRSGQQFESRFVLQAASTVCIRSKVAATSGPRYGVNLTRVHRGGEADIGAGQASPGEEFEFCGIPAGEYRLTARNGTGTVAWQRFTVLNRELRVPDLIPGMAWPMEVRPHLLPAQDGASLPTALQIRAEAVDRSYEVDESADAERDGTGRLVFTVHFDDVYRLQVTGLAAGQYVASATVEGHDAYAAPFHPSNSPMDLAIATDGPTVAGQVRDPSGQPVSGAAVTLAAWPLPSPLAPNRLLTAETDDQGNYRFTNMPPGTYRVAAYPGLPRYLNGNPTFARDQMGRASLVELAPGELKLLPLTIVETPKAR